jgi:photosystem II stability/assembly factor-like uncharacterized protein
MSKSKSSKTKAILLTIGTIKGLFIARSNDTGKSWKISDPIFTGRQVYAAAYDRKTSRLWASATSMHFGAELFSSDDLGQKWTLPKQPLIQFPKESNETLKNIWQILPSSVEEKTIYCGVEPSCLFVSRDGGKSFKPVESFLNHPQRKEWMPGGGGLCLHSLIQDSKDAKKIWTATSTGGVYKTMDGGKSWNPSNKGIKAVFLPDPEVEFGQCVHKFAQHPVKPNVFYLQHHWGVYRSEDSGATWQNIGKSLPSDFGFGIAISKIEPYYVYVFPLKSDEFRVCPEGEMAVYRTSEKDPKKWKKLSKGMPHDKVYETVLRDGLTVDDAEGVYFGTRNGSIWASRNAGKSWKEIFDSLPAVLSVKAYSI